MSSPLGLTFDSSKQGVSVGKPYKVYGGGQGQKVKSLFNGSSVFTPYPDGQVDPKTGTSLRVKKQADIHNNDSVIPVINPENYASLKAGGQVNEGMIPKLDNAFEALQKGVNRVIIGDALDIEKLIAGTSGTTIQKK